MATIRHIHQIDDIITIDLDVNGVQVSVSVKNDVTVMALNAGVKVAEQLSYGNGQSVRMYIRPHTPDAAPDETCEHGSRMGECYTEICSFNRYGERR